MTVTFLCPICSSTDYKPYLELKDHSVTKETFKLLECTRCNLIQTHPIPKDLNKYYQSADYISHADKPVTFIDRVYFKARAYALQWKEKILHKNTPESKTLLDYGCGTGTFLKYCADNGWKTKGVETSEQARAIAQTLTNTLIASDIHSIDQDQFNVITLWHVLEHIADLNATVHELKERLTKNGTMFIAVPNYKSKDAHHYASYWAAYDVPRHLWHFSQKTMAGMMRKHALKIQDIIPMKLDAYYVSMLSEKYRHNDQTTIASLLSAVINGIQSNFNARTSKEYSSLIYVIRHETP